MISIPLGTHTHVIGNSITNAGWDIVQAGLRDQMTQARQLASAGTGDGAQVSAGRAALRAGASASFVVPAAPLKHTSHGVPGYRISDVIAHYPEFITAFLPLDVLILEIGVNEIVLSTDPAVFVVQYGQFLDQVHADAPSAKIVCLGILCSGSEQWLTGPNRLANGLSQSQPIEAAIISCAAARSFCEYANQCDWVLAWEMVNNAPSPGAVDGKLTDSPGGIHPLQAGQQLMGTHLMPHFYFP